MQESRASIACADHFSEKATKYFMSWQIPGPADTALPLLRARLAPSSGSAARQAPTQQALDATTILAGHLEAWGLRSSQVCQDHLISGSAQCVPWRGSGPLASPSHNCS